MQTAASTAPQAPSSFASLRDLLIERQANLPKRLAQVAKFTLDRPDEMALGTIAELAAAAGVQPSALVRFAQTFGYSGFSELQQVLRARLRERWPDYQERLAKVQDETGQGADSTPVLTRLIEISVHSLTRLTSSVTPAAFDHAVTTLAGARMIYLLAQRRAFPVSAYLSYMFGNLGMPHLLLDNVGGMIDVQASSAGPQDALLAITFTPYAPATVQIATKAADRGVPIVAITDSAFSPIASVSQAWLEVVEADLGAFRTLSGTMGLAMSLAIATAERRRALEAA
ncbi:MurR/RpiR family transcriptional regulator [Acidocella aminolytica]|uniref:Transcriptional regulator RpiR n=2 Tax=Acidocella TaxID=50709 RepID=A0A0D6PGF6_9PROT|nr:MurR/RpiR family transcriptional regulator [Acidocella aminolytica]GAN80855.1 transcriptional regulator RpiR [Acidocella aminolytica 101 = DSM 11237]SHE31704.1 transcriptional regulator, RpiR family [Acidocella aminolytica 101 = DSM 11237]